MCQQAREPVRTGVGENLPRVVGGAGRREMGEQVIEHGRPLLVEGKGIQAPFDLLLHGLERGALVIAETAAEFGVV